MKNLLILITIMLVGVGCGRNLTEEEKKLLKKVVGSYEYTSLFAESERFDLLENGKVNRYINGEKFERKWKVLKKEVLVANLIYKVEPKGDLTEIAMIVDGKRIDNPTVWLPLSSSPDQRTYKKIK